MKKPVRIAACALATLLGSTSAAAQSVPGSSLRIATYNAYLLSPAFKCLDFSKTAPLDCFTQVEGQTESWARRLASTILANRANIDVIALNEVWDEDAKKILADRLRNTYPVQIRDIDADLVNVRASVLSDIPESFHARVGARFLGEDSGLMLFAKRDFKVLPLPDPAMKWGINAGEVLDASNKNVAFTLFGLCGSDDCMAAKGAGLVRLQHKASRRIHNIVFTHMQADYPEDDEFFRTERKSQLDQVQKLIETSLGPIALGSIAQGAESLIFLGDLNVPYLKSRAEWDERFANGGFFRSPLYESWHYTSSQADLTPTNDTDEERLDYIMASPNEGSNEGAVLRRQCVQHVTVPTVFADLESDHAMVHADMATGFYHCSPSLAFKLDLPPANIAIVDKSPGNNVDITRINSAGGMQWFYLDTGSAGTYSIGTSNPDNIDIEIYAPEDLTRPISRYNQTPRPAPPGIARTFVTDQYVLPAKFFIRTSGAARTTVADYALYVERHNCATKEKACILMPGQPQSVTLSGQTLPPGQLTPQNEAWFRFDVVGTAESGKAQTISLDASLVDAARVTSLIDGFSGSPALAMSASSNINSYKGAAADGDEGFLVIKQSLPAPQPTVVNGLLDSNIRFLTVKNLVCKDETNPELGSDDIFTRVIVDGIGRRAPTSGNVPFDCDNHSHPRQWASRVGAKEIAFLDEFVMRIYEEDDTSDDDQSRRKVVPAMADGELLREDARLTFIFDDGEYRFFYDLRRRRDGPVANP
jgi:hypothetical protein